MLFSFGKMRGFGSRGGFTLGELMIASAIGVLVMGGALSVFVYVAVRGRSLGAQVDFDNQARSLMGRFPDLVERAKVAASEYGANTDGSFDSLLLYYADGTVGRIAYRDADNDSSTLGDNEIYYQPDNTESATYVVCRNVSPLAGATGIMRIVAGSTVGLLAHIGDSPDRSAPDVTGKGLQGVELRISATPRNVQRVYEKTSTQK